MLLHFMFNFLYTLVNYPIFGRPFFGRIIFWNFFPSIFSKQIQEMLAVNMWMAPKKLREAV